MLRMPGYVLTLPLLPGKVEAWRRFCQELSGSRRPRYEASRRRLGITHERLGLVESPLEAVAIITLETLHLGLSLAELLASEPPFESWYRERLQELPGVTFTRYEDAQPPALQQELLFEWTSMGGVASD
jgi:hypothetical protein